MTIARPVVFTSLRKWHSSRMALGIALVTSLATPGEVRAEEAEAAELASKDDLVVTGQRDKPQINAGALGARSILETPFSIGSVGSDTIERIAATTIDAAFNYDASIRSNNSGVASGNTFVSRGLAIDLTNGYKLDGLPFPYWFQDHPIEHLSEIQILKGAGGFLYGFAAPGGIVNFISKRPTADFEASVNLSFRSSSIWRAHLDIGGPLGQSDSLGFRFNTAHEEGTLYNGAYNRNQFISLALQGDITDSLSWTLDGFYQRTLQTRQSNSISFTTDVTELKPVSGKLNLGAKGTSKFNDVPILTGKLNWDFATDWTATLALRYASIDERFPGNIIQIQNNEGRYRSNAYNMNRIFWYHLGQATVEGKFNTGPLEHQIIAGVAATSVDFDYDNPTRQYTLGYGNIYDPSTTPALTGNPAGLYNHRPPFWTRYQEIQQNALFVSDTIRLDRLSLLLGFRYTDYEEENFNATGGTTSYFHFKPVTPTYSISYDIEKKTRVYATYVESLQRGAIAAATTNNPNDSFGPLKSKQYEFGLKTEQGKWNATLAFYRILQQSEYVNADNYFVRDGQARHQGVEFNASIFPTRNLFVGLSAAYLDAKQISGNPLIIGKKIAGATAFQASGIAEYSLPFIEGLKVNAGIRHSGKAYGHAANTFVFLSSTVGDVGASYSFSSGDREYTIRGFVQNVTNEKYWVPKAAGLSAGAPRTFSVSAEMALTKSGSTGGGYGGRTGETGPYIGVEGGAFFAKGFTADAQEKVNNPASAAVRNALRVKHDAGWELGGTFGYDLGKFRAEVEASYKEAGVGSIRLNDITVPLDTAGGPASTGLYAGAGGRTRVLSFLGNGLIDIGGTPRSPWGAFFGGGIGLARVTVSKWNIAPDTAPYFSDDNVTAFAWQAIAGVRRSLTDRVDVSLKYRYFNVPNLKLRTMSANEITGDLHSHSILAGATLNF